MKNALPGAHECRLGGPSAVDSSRPYDWRVSGGRVCVQESVATGAVTRRVTAFGMTTKNADTLPSFPGIRNHPKARQNQEPPSTPQTNGESPRARVEQTATSQ